MPIGCCVLSFIGFLYFVKIMLLCLTITLLAFLPQSGSYRTLLRTSLQYTLIYVLHFGEPITHRLELNDQICLDRRQSEDIHEMRCHNRGQNAIGINGILHFRCVIEGGPFWIITSILCDPKHACAWFFFPVSSNEICDSGGHSYLFHYGSSFVWKLWCGSSQSCLEYCHKLLACPIFIRGLKETPSLGTRSTKLEQHFSSLLPQEISSGSICTPCLYGKQEFLVIGLWWPC